MNSNPENPMRPYLRSQEVADLLGVSLRTVGNWKRHRVIPHHKIGRVVLFRRDEIEAAIGKFRIAAVSDRPLRSISRSPSKADSAENNFGAATVRSRGSTHNP